MSKFNLQKAVEQTKFVLNKKSIPNVRASVVMNIDVSGSAQGLFRSGQIQEAFQRVLPVGIIFDDNQEIDVFTFANSDMVAHIEPNATEKNYENYIKKNILDNRDVPKWGGTEYSPAIEANLETLGFYSEEKSGGILGFGAKTTKKLRENNDSGFPAIVYFFTDGENNRGDMPKTIELLKKCQEANTQMYFLFIGIGNADFSFIDKIGDMFPNVGFLNVKNLEDLSGDDAYEQLLPDELCTWLKSK